MAEILRRALQRQERQRVYDRRRYQEKKNGEVTLSAAGSPTSNDILPVKENRKDGDYVSCVQCTTSIAYQSVVRCIMCSEPRHARSKCLAIPIPDDRIMAVYGYKGSSAYICSKCARHITTCKDQVITKSAMTNGIRNATKTMEEKLSQLESEVLKERAMWAKKQAEFLEEKKALVKRLEKKSDKHRNCVDVSIVNRMEESNRQLVSDVKAMLTACHETLSAKRKRRNSSSSSSSSNGGSSSASNSDDDNNDGKEKSNNTQLTSIPKIPIRKPQLSAPTSEDEQASCSNDQRASNRIVSNTNGNNRPNTMSKTNNAVEYDPLQPQMLPANSGTAGSYNPQTTTLSDMRNIKEVSVNVDNSINFSEIVQSVSNDIEYNPQFAGDFEIDWSLTL